jgi:hypothetical protein
VPAIAALGGDSHATRTRAGLIASQFPGLALARYVLRLPPVVALPPDERVDRIAPIIQELPVAGAW